MSSQTRTHIYCDKCTEVYSDMEGRKVTLLRKFAKSEGWIYRRVRPFSGWSGMEDVCNECLAKETNDE
jgi:hypothetical protein